LILCHDGLLTALKVEEALVVGHSFGGMVACEQAAAYPRRLRRLALIDPIRAGNFFAVVQGVKSGEQGKFLG
jgi:pimeloyl-ACP methyl ester carboxylesterase